MMLLLHSVSVPSPWEWVIKLVLRRMTPLNPIDILSLPNSIVKTRVKRMDFHSASIATSIRNYLVVLSRKVIS